MIQWTVSRCSILHTLVLLCYIFSPRSPWYDSYDNTGSSLSSDQWTLELQQWFGASLAVTEMAAKQFVTGFGDEVYDQYIKPAAAQDDWMCHAQVTKSAMYALFNVHGMSIVLVFGGLIVLMNLFAEVIVPAASMPGQARCS